MDIETKLREILLPVLGLTSIEEIKPENALVADLGADSIDFVEIIYLIERNFGVVLKTNQIFSGGLKVSADDLFQDGTLTQEGADMINKRINPVKPFLAGINKAQLFSALTVKDLANIIKLKKNEEA